MKKFFSLTLTLAAMLSAMAVSAQAADYSFETDGTPEYYPSSSYEDVYGSRYNYGGKNVVDYQIPELEYGQFSTTQTGVMEKIMLPGLQSISASGGGIYGISPGGGTVEIPAGRLHNLSCNARFHGADTGFSALQRRRRKDLHSCHRS